jgi:hypothetical protein
MTNVTVVSSAESLSTYKFTQFQNPDYNLKKVFPLQFDSTWEAFVVRIRTKYLRLQVLRVLANFTLVKETESAFCTTYIGVL